MPISFADTHQSLCLGVVDCAITGQSYGQFGRLARSHDASHADRIPDGVQRLRHQHEVVDKLTPDQQVKLRRPSSARRRDLDVFEELFDDAVRCNAGKDPCTTGKKYGSRTCRSPADIELVRKASVRFAAGLGRGLRQVQPGLLRRMESVGRTGAGDVNAGLRGTLAMARLAGGSANATVAVFGGLPAGFAAMVRRDDCRKIFNISLQGADELGGYALAVGLRCLQPGAPGSRAHPRRRLPREVPARTACRAELDLRRHAPASLRSRLVGVKVSATRRLRQHGADAVGDAAICRRASGTQAS